MYKDTEAACSGNLYCLNSEAPCNYENKNTVTAAGIPVESHCVLIRIVTLFCPHAEKVAYGKTAAFISLFMASVFATSPLPMFSTHHQYGLIAG